MRTNALSTLCEKSSCKVNELKNIIVGVKQNFVGIIIIIKSLLKRKEAQQTCAFTIPIELNYNYND